eukprot:364947-Chlamydomonas_euryale.AAC.9
MEVCRGGFQGAFEHLSPGATRFSHQDVLPPQTHSRTRGASHATFMDWCGGHRMHPHAHSGPSRPCSCDRRLSRPSGRYSRQGQTRLQQTAMCICSSHLRSTTSAYVVFFLKKIQTHTYLAFCICTPNMPYTHERTSVPLARLTDHAVDAAV